jgi:hypothetical protein
MRRSGHCFTGWLQATHFGSKVGFIHPDFNCRQPIQRLPIALADRGATVDASREFQAHGYGFPVAFVAERWHLDG